MVYSRPSDPRARTSSKVSSVVTRPLTPVTRARSTGSSFHAPGAVGRIAEERAHAVHLVALDVEQEHVGRFRVDLDRELLEQARLQRPHADDEERAEADGQQDDARLVAGPRQVQHGVPQRKRAVRSPAAPGARTSSRPASTRTTASTANPRQTTSPTRSDAACQAATATSAADTNTMAAIRTASRCGGRVSSRSSSDGLTSRTSSSGTMREQQRHEDADRRALQRHAPGHRVVHACQQRRRRRAERQRNGRDRGLRDGHAEKASRQPQRHHLQQVDGDDLAARRARGT